MYKLGTLIVTVILALTLASAAFAQEGVPQNCDAFPNQQEAQSFFDASPGDPEGLDANNNGIACEELEGTPVPAPVVAPEESSTPSVEPSASQYQYGETAPLPETGGPSILLLATGAVLIFAGVAARYILR
jgi:hypothetical protein